jgi:membrane-associated phospholipid phosphatase
VAAVASDYAWLVAQWYGQVVDVFFVSYLFDDFNFDVAWQLSMLNAEAMSLGFIFTRGSHRLVARARPVREGCENDSGDAELCPFRGTHASFPSGHTSMSFVGAGLTCAHHQYLPIYGSRIGDAAACGANIALAGASGALRLISDRHWLSDVLIGAVFGFAVGYGLPVLLHYGYGSSEGFGRSSAALVSGKNAPSILSWSGRF